VSTGQQGQVTQQGQATQQASAIPAANLVREFFKLLAETGFQPRLRYTRGVCRFDVEGVGSWRVAVNEGTLTVSETSKEDTSPVDVVFSTTADVVLRILDPEDELNVFAAFLQGTVAARGDPVFGWALVQGLTPSRLAPARQ
jgi:hypothetical protein